MKPNISKLKHIRGRRIVGYRASIGAVEGDGRTAAEALEACEKSALAALSRLEHGMTVRQWREHRYIIIPTLHGWSYWLDTFSGNYGCTCGNASKEETAESALIHLAQSVWETSVENDALFLEGLPERAKSTMVQWIKFQRAHARLTAEGKTGTEAHRLACEESYT